MKLYTMSWDSSMMFPSTPTLVKWLRAIKKLELEGATQYSALDVMNKALQETGWETKNEGNPERMMETWAYYVKTLKELGLRECGQTGGKKKALTLEELLGE